ncbi:hypothetical protein A9Q99_10545 [Gammaproteobacteria bacterium 45_16_T64]|nr:hypothetical protein A9Q99_10545 [Gammaproteobacteria bacterium 45_16_T64]
MVYFAHIIGAFLLVNGIPHFVQGVSGNRFQSPFASPPGIGESSAMINVLWGFTNLVGGYTLLFQVGEFHAGVNIDTLITGIAALSFALVLAWHFGRVRH